MLETAHLAVAYLGDHPDLTIYHVGLASSDMSDPVKRRLAGHELHADRAL